MTGRILIPCTCVEATTTRSVSRGSGNVGKLLVTGCRTGVTERSSSGRRRRLVRLHSSFTNAGPDSDLFSKILTLYDGTSVGKKGAGIGRHTCVGVAVEPVARSGSSTHNDQKALLSLDTEQRNVRAREALETNLAESSPRSEDQSGAPDMPLIVNGYGAASTSTLVLDRKPLTGGAFDYTGATAPLSSVPIPQTKKIVLVRHGLSTWNREGRIQGSSDLSLLSDEGIAQAERCKRALAKLKFSSCFASPISRAKTSAEVIWSGREEPLIYLDTLKEANLLVLEGMRNVDAKVQYPELYRTWREDPVNFQINGVYPVVNLWAQARRAWHEILSSEGDLVLVVTHKSILRALLCTALGMGPDRFRAVDINNGGISMFTVNTSGEPLLQCLNMTAHMHADGVFY